MYLLLIELINKPHYISIICKSSKTVLVLKRVFTFSISISDHCFSHSQTDFFYHLPRL